MHFQYNPYIWIYLGGVAVSLSITAFMAYKRAADRYWLITQVMVGIWALGFALQISGSNLATMAFWYTVANDFVGMKTPIPWLLWSLTVAGKKSWITSRRVVLLLVLPLLTDLLNLTNAWHGLMYRQMSQGLSGRYLILLFTYGPWYWVITAYSCCVLVAIIVVQIRAAVNRELLHRRLGIAVAAATAAVLLYIVISLIFPELFCYRDYTPLMISLAALSAGLFSRFRAQEPVPVPRNAVMEKMTSAVIILDNHDRIMDLNPAAEALFGLKDAQVAGSVFTGVMSHWPELAAAARDGFAGHLEFSKDGKFYEASFSGLTDGRKAAGRLVVIQDVTANKATEERLLQQQQALLVLQERERLARELHDSLGQVLGYTSCQIQALREMLKSGQTAMAGEGLARLSQVIAEANTEVREFIYEVKATLLFRDGFFATLQQYLTRYEQNFQIRTAAHNPDRLDDEDLDLPAGVQLFRIIQEALTNTRKHARATEATVTFHREGGRIRIVAADNGVGFDPQALPSSRSSFGLEVMRERAGQIGGEIRIESAPGQGTRVIVTVPLLARQEPIPAASPESGAAGTLPALIRVMLVDDHPLFMEGLKNLIGPKGFVVVGTARDGLEALEKARLLRPEMILMDLQMPRCNGLTATRLIKEELPDTKIVILTMSDREHDLFTALKNGACGYLLKGLRADELIDQLAGLASGAASAISPELAAQVLGEFDQAETAVSEAGQAGPERILSSQQIEILALVAGGDTYKEVAAKLFLSERTIKYRMAEILRQLHLQTRQQAIAYARRVGLGQEGGGES